MNRLDIGFPDVANMYRTMKPEFYPTRLHILPRSEIIPLGEDNMFYKDWMDYNRRSLFDKLYNANLSKARNLLPRYPQLPKSGNKAQVLFGVHNDDMQMIKDHQHKIKNIYSGGGLYLPTANSAIGMTPSETEKERLKIIEKLRRSLQGEQVSEQPMGPEEELIGSEPTYGQLTPTSYDTSILSSSLGEDEKIQFDLLISSLLDKIYGGIIDSSTYRDLTTVARYIFKNVWTFDDETFKELIKEFDELNSQVLAVVHQYEHKELDSFYAKTSLQYAPSALLLIERLIQYLEKNYSAINKSPEQRQSLAKSLSKQFRLTESKVDKLRYQQEKRQYKKEEKKYNEENKKRIAEGLPALEPFRPFEPTIGDERLIPQLELGQLEAPQMSAPISAPLYSILPRQIQSPQLKASGKRRKGKKNVNKRLTKLY